MQVTYANIVSLAVSSAHKMGLQVFLVWEDIVQVRPKMMLCLLAAAMAEDLRRTLERDRQRLSATLGPALERGSSSG